MPPMTIDTGNTGFMILCSSLVMLMTPGLAFFYGGLVGRKNVLAIMIQSFVSMGWTARCYGIFTDIPFVLAAANTESSGISICVACMGLI